MHLVSQYRSEKVMGSLWFLQALVLLSVSEHVRKKHQLCKPTGGGLFLPFFLGGGHVLIKFMDSRHIQLAIYTACDRESGVQLNNNKIQQPETKVQEEISKNGPEEKHLARPT